MRPPATADGLPDVGNSAVRTRDLILLCIFIFTLMYCWHERSYFDYRLEPTWFVQNPVREVVRRGRRVLDLVPPLLTDLDENGRQELVALVSSDADDSDDGDEGGVADPTARFRLQLLDVYQDPSLVLDDVFHPRVMAGMPLSGSKVRPPPDAPLRAALTTTTLRVQTSAPVAMAAGPLAPTADGAQPDGLIAVAFENLTVAAFSATPRDSLVARRWLVDLVNASSPLTGGGLTEAHRRRCPSDYVTRVHYERGADAHGGDVVVVSLSPAATPATQRAPCAASAGGDVPPEDETVRVFALAAEDGQLLWQFHAGVDDESSAALATALPQQPLSLDLREQLLRHSGARARHGHSAGYHWQLFRSSLLHQLPFGWFSDEDEALHAAHFDRPARLGDVRTRSAPGDAAGGAAMKKPPQPKRATPTRRRGGGPRLKSLLKLPLAPLAPLVGRAAANRSDARAPVDPARRSLYLHAQQHAQRRGRRSGERDNVVVLRHSGGLHVLALQTGAPLASLALPAERLYADVDGDRTLDSFFFPFASAATADVLGQTLTDGGEDCAALCLSGLPPTAPLFNSTALCGLGHANRRSGGGGAEAATGRRGRRGRRGGRGRRRTHGEHLPEATASFAHAAVSHAAGDNSSGPAAAAAAPVAVSFAVPLLLPRDRSLGAADYATGSVDSMREAADKRLAAVVLSSVGVLTALDERGDVLWQDFSSCAPFPAQRRYPAFTPRVLLFDPFAGVAGGAAEELQLLLVVQESSLVLLSLTGQVLHTLRLPGRLASSAVLLGDENGDGVVDTLVLAGEAALLGYRVEVKPVLYPMFLPLAVLLGIAALVWLSKMQLPNLLAADDQRAALGDWWIKTTRATDSLHLD